MRDSPVSLRSWALDPARLQTALGPIIDILEQRIHHPSLRITK